MFHTLYYVKDTGSKRDRQEHYYGLVTDLESIEQVKNNITESNGTCLFAMYPNVNSVFNYSNII